VGGVSVECECVCRLNVDVFTCWLYWQLTRLPGTHVGVHSAVMCEYARGSRWVHTWRERRARANAWSGVDNAKQRIREDCPAMADAMRAAGMAPC